MNVDELRSEIQAACDAAVGRGLTIAAHEWGVEWDEDGTLIAPWVGDCVCPLAALAIARNISAENTDGDPDDIIGAALGLKGVEVSDFARGFDGSALPSGHEPLWWSLGQEFRAQFCDEEGDDDSAEAAP